MPLHLLPIRSAGAAENMATDFLLLKRYPETGDTPAARFRHYGWHRPAFTFGYSQKIAAVRAQLPGGGEDDPVSGNRLELCRRPTGGGVVDHRDDWTYALVIPRGHDLEAARAIESYRAIHQALADALAAQGANVRLQDPAGQPGAAAFLPLPDTGNSGDASRRRSGTNAAAPAAASVCFVQAEPFDVIDARTGQKIAGAAQKRTKNGLLFQGSVWCPAAEAALLPAPLPPPPLRRRVRSTATPFTTPSPPRSPACCVWKPKRHRGPTLPKANSMRSPGTTPRPNGTLFANPCRTRPA
ncbi:lipoate-protein ligase A [Opitutaceae bacterium TAV1]|nr:lipoate-protein ligase A [Opitutaceae bacterium TAV1]